MYFQPSSLWEPDVVTFLKGHGNESRITGDVREHGHTWHVATIALCIFTLSFSSMLWLLTVAFWCGWVPCKWYFQLYREDYMLRVWGRFIFSESWNTSIDLQKHCDSVLCGPSVMGNCWASVLRAHSESGWQMRTIKQTSKLMSFYVTK